MTSQDLWIFGLALVTGAGYVLAAEYYLCWRQAVRELAETRAARDLAAARLLRSRDCLAKVATRAMAVPGLLEERAAMLAELERGSHDRP